MTRKSKFFSAISIAAAGALMITTTAYQSKAADSPAMGDSYAGTQLADVTTISHGTFNYDDPSAAGEEIKLSGGDITNLATAVNALSAQVFDVGAKAKAADAEVVSTTVEAINAAKNAIVGNIGSPANPTGYATWQDIPTDYVKSSELEALRSKLNAIEVAANQAADASKPMPTLTVGALNPGVVASLYHTELAPSSDTYEPENHYYGAYINLYGNFNPVAYDFYSSPYVNRESYLFDISGTIFTGDASWPFIENYLIGYSGDGTLSCSVSGDTESFSASISGNTLTVKSRPVKSGYVASAQIKVSASSGKEYHSTSQTYSFSMDYSKFIVSGRPQTVDSTMFEYSSYQDTGNGYVTSLTATGTHKYSPATVYGKLVRASYYSNNSPYYYWEISTAERAGYSNYSSGTYLPTGRSRQQIYPIIK